MSRDAIFEKIKDVFDDFFDGAVKITKDTTYEDVEEWDSIAHFQLIFEIEEAFGVQFETEKIAMLNTIEKIVDSIEKSNC